MCKQYLTVVGRGGASLSASDTVNRVGHKTHLRACEMINGVKRNNKTKFFQLQTIINSKLDQMTSLGGKSV